MTPWIFRDITRGALRHPRVLLAHIMLLSCLFIYIPFIDNPRDVAAFWDGPMYIVVAKTFYAIDQEMAASIGPLPPHYYSCHLPLYPCLIRLCSTVLLGDYVLGMLLATVLCAIASVILFYEVLLRFRLSTHPLWLSVLFCFIPPRWLIYHSVGASEPLFICLMFLCFLAYRAQNPLLLAGLIALASLTRLVGALLGPAFLILYVMERNWKSALIVPSSAVGIIALFTYYWYRFGDFFAYFSYNVSTENIVRWPPLTAILTAIASPNFHEGEYYLLTYGLYGVGLMLLRAEKPFFVFCATYFVFMTFVFHPDISRYFIPIAPFAFLVAYQQILCAKYARILIACTIPLFFIHGWKYITINRLSEWAFEHLLTL